MEDYFLRERDEEIRNLIQEAAQRYFSKRGVKDQPNLPLEGGYLSRDKRRGYSGINVPFIQGSAVREANNES